MYNLLIDTDFEPCIRAENPLEPVCEEPPTGENVLSALSKVFDVLSAENTMTVDALALLAQAVFFKLLYIAGVLYHTRKTTKIFPPSG